MGNLDNSAIIRDVGSTLANIVKLSLAAAGLGKVSVLLAPPSRAALAKKSPAVCIYLLNVDGVTETIDVEQDLIQEEQPDGSVKEWLLDPPLRIRMDWLLSAWADDPLEEQQLLARGMKALLEYPIFDEKVIVGQTITSEDRVSVTLDEKMPMAQKCQILQGFGEAVRPIAIYNVFAHIISERRSPEIKRVLTRDIGLINKATGRRMT